MTKRDRNNWGGARERSGRPRSPSRSISSEPHKTRAEVTASHAVHVSARVVDAIRNLDTTRLQAALDRALSLSLARADFRIVHLGVRRTRLELIVEAADKLALARGMQGFQVSAARSLNRAARRSGTVFVDRYAIRGSASVRLGGGIQRAGWVASPQSRPGSRSRLPWRILWHSP